MDLTQIFGEGYGAFRSKYMVGQAIYIKDNSDSLFSELADNINHPLNEYLLAIYEHGLLSLLLALVILCYLGKISRKNPAYFLSVLSVLITGFFSYPLKYWSILVILAFCLAKISRESKSFLVFRTNLLGASFVAVLLLFVSLMVGKDAFYEYKWGRCYEFAKQGNNDEVVLTYDNIYRRWNNNPYFLYNYASELNYLEQYEKSLYILSECMDKLNDYDVQMLQANNYFNLTNYSEAEKHYKLAGEMIPKKFMPSFQLIKLYEMTNQKEKMSDLIHRFLSRKPKVPSREIEIMKSIVEAKLTVIEKGML